MVGVTTINPISSTEYHITAYNVREINVGKTYRCTKTKYLPAASPVTKAYWKSIRILFFQRIDISSIPFHVRTQTLAIRLIHKRNCI